MSDEITDLIEEIRRNQQNTLEAVKSLMLMEDENLLSNIEEIRRTELEIIGEIESLITGESELR